MPDNANYQGKLATDGDASSDHGQRTEYRQASHFLLAAKRSSSRVKLSNHRIAGREFRLGKFVEIEILSAT